MRYSKSAIALASFAAVLWSGAVALLIGQVDGVVPTSVATFTAIIACAVTVVWALDRVAARFANRATRPPIVIHPAWNWALASQTTVHGTRAPNRVVSVPVPVLSMSGGGDGETTLGIRRSGGTATQERTRVRDDVYWQAYSDLAEDILCTMDADPDG